MSVQKQSVWHWVMKWSILGASPQSSSSLVGLALKVERRVIGFGQIYVLVMHGMSSLIYLMSLISIKQRRTPKDHQVQSAVMSSGGFWAFEFHINSKSMRFNLKKYALSFIPIFASFYIFCFHIQYHLRPQLAHLIGIGCLHLRMCM